MKKIVFLLIFCILIAGCRNTDNSSEESKSQNLLPIAKTGQGFTLGLFNKNTIESKRTFTINSGKFEKNIIFGNRTENKESFILFIFDHGVQIEFNVNNTDMKFYRFTLDKDQEKNIPLKISGIKDGFHAINMMIMRSPDNIVTDSNHLDSADTLSQVYNIRINILKNITSIPIDRPEQINGQKLKESRIHGIFLSPEKEMFKALLKAPNTETIKFSVLYGNLEPEPIDFYLVTLLNWEQIDINNKAYLYDSLNGKENKKIEATIKNNNVGGNLVFLMLPNPFKPLPDENPYTVSPFASFKVSVGG